MLHEFIFLIAGALIGWGISEAYYRRTKADLKDIVERAIAEGIVSAVRDTQGKLKGLAPPNAPTDFKIF
jgi:hypothetical protein